MLVTFYSYKGGVGRSLALANIACLLAEDREHPQRILVWDFDLEAPGLHRMFPPKRPITYGFLDMAHEFASTGKLDNVNDYIYESRIPGVSVLHAGKVNEDYCRKLQEINWTAFFGEDPKKTGPFFGGILKSLEERDEPFDYVLIDSRTGLNDQAGICTEVLSELLVVLFRLSEQNLDGLEHVIPAIRSQLESRGKNEVEILPIASQVGAASSHNFSKELRKEAANIFGQELKYYIRFDVGLVSREDLLCLQDAKTQIWPSLPIIDDYESICRAIRKRNINDTRTQAENLRRLLREGDSTGIVEIIPKLLERRPNLEQVWQVLGQLYNDLSETRKEELSGIIEKIIKENPKNPFANQWKALGIVKKATEPNESLDEARKYLEISLDNAGDRYKGRVYQAIGMIESCQRNHKEAIEAFRNARDCSPKNHQIRLELTKMYLRSGAKFFAFVDEELEAIPEDLGQTKYRILALLRAFLGEDEKALEALEHCGKDMKALAEGYMFLMKGEGCKAIEMAKKNISSAKRKKTDTWSLPNWVELLLCTQEFEQVQAIFEKHANEELSQLANLACYLQGNKSQSELKKIKNDVLFAWKQGWDFTELLMFRECCRRDGETFGGRIDIIEDVVAQSDLSRIKSSGLGLFSGKSAFRPEGFSPRNVRVVFEGAS